MKTNIPGLKKCCDKCYSNYIEYNYPDHIMHDVCINLSCECHIPPNAERTGDMGRICTHPRSTTQGSLNTPCSICQPSSSSQKIEKGEFELWLHPKQKDGWVKGTEIREYLEKNNLMENCFTKEELEEIQRKEVLFYRKHFGNKLVYAWKSVVRDGLGGLCVPDLYESGGKVFLGWRWLGSDFDSRDVALRFASSTKALETKTSASFELSPSDLAILKSAGDVINRIIKSHE